MNSIKNSMKREGRKFHNRSPLRLLVVTITSVFVGEAALMAFLAWLPRLPMAWVALLDALLITLLALPALYVWFYRPLEQELVQRRKTAEALRKNELRLSRYFNASVVGMAIVSPDRTWMDFNRRMCDILGYAADELKAKTWTEVTHPEDVAEDLAKFEQICNGNSDGYVVDRRFVRADGTISHSTVYTRGVRFEDGTLDYCVVVVLDQTARRRTEAMLRSVVEGTSHAVGQDFFSKSVEHLAMALEFRNAFIGQIVDEDCTRVRVLAAWGEGKPGENTEYELKGTPCHDCARVRVMTSQGEGKPGKYTEYALRGKRFDNVARHTVCLHPSGVQDKFPGDNMLKQMCAESYLGALLFDSGDKPIGLIAVLDDKPFPDNLQEQAKSLLSVFGSRAAAELARNEAIRQLQESEKKYRSYVDHAPDGIFVTDRQGNIVDVNDAATQIIGYSRQQLLDMAFSDIVAPEAVDKGEEHFEIVAETGSASGEVLLRRQDGPRIWSLIDSGQISEDRFVSFVNDVTDRRRAEEELAKAQKLESVGVLAGGLAHDFNNLLTGIVGNVSLVKDHLDRNSDNYEFLQDAEQAALRATDLTKQLLTFAKGGDPIRRVVRIEEVVADAANLAARGLRLQLQIEADDDLPRVKVDRGQIGQVIHNLVLNADEAMPEGGNLWIRMQNAQIPPKSSLPLDSGRYVMISVSDEGIGIPQENLPKIFDPYFSTKLHGSGLGLASVYSIIKKHKGHVDVESTIDRGTTFRICLPATAEAGETQGLPPAARKVPGKKVLVMDDEKVIRNLMQRILGAEGYEVVTASNGVDAVSEFVAALDNNLPYDTVILDLTMPGGRGGRDILVELKSLDPAVKAIVCSGYSSDPVMSDYRKYGFNGVVTKPFRPDRLLEVVNSLLPHETELVPA